ncbi:hypothetical protein [Streptomyces sp. rh34]|uniref:hypothetical protein n=1 Tax=Streptomyces sp. rh34 TaxID=2034272 RepID=UPI000BEFAB6D|nr:hypothetical protein [Streptomyces sp. rh34]
MAATMTISLRVPQEMRDQLERVSVEYRTTMSAVAVSAIRMYLDGAEPPTDGPLVLAVDALFAEQDLYTSTEREMALALARTGQAGGTAGVAAIKELRVLLDALGVEDDDLTDLHLPG